MTLAREMLLALRLARRELRGGVAGFWVFLACLALGVGTVAAVGLVSASVNAGLRAEARTLLGGDLLVERTHLEPPPGVRELLAERGASIPYVRARVMARTTTGAALAEIKAVSDGYPLYGAVELDAPATLAQSLAYADGAWGAVADAELLARLGIGPGDTLRVGEARYRITARLLREPDRTAQFWGLGPRLMVAHASLTDTGLLRPGSLVRHGLALRLPGRATPQAVAALGEELTARFPDTGLRIRRFDGSAGGITRFMEKMGLYLTLVGLAALLVGGIGVAGAVRAYLAGRIASIAVMKSLGAVRRLITAAYLLQIGGLALAGSLAGAVLGVVVSTAIAGPLAERFGVPLAGGVHFAPLAVAVSYGLLTALAFSLWPLSAAGSVSPTRLFRGYADGGAMRPTWLALLGVGAAGVGMLAMLWLSSGDWGVTVGFAVATLVCMVTYRLFSLLLIAVTRRVPRPANPRLRHALTNIHRPGSSAPGVVFSVGLGLTVLTALALVDGNLQDQIRRQTPASAPSFFFWDVRQQDVAAFESTALAVPGITRLEKRPSIRGRVVEINGVPADPANVHPDTAWALRSDRGLTFAAAMPDKVELRSGAWWGEEYDGPPVICLDHKIADGFGLSLGDTLTVSVLGRRITAAVVATRDIDWSQGGLNHVIIFGPGVLEDAPYTYLAAVYADPAQAQAAEPAVFAALTGAFPDIPVVSMKNVLEDIAKIIKDIGLAVRVTALAALAAGLLALAQAMRATMRSRHRDAVVFKTLGATRRDVMLTLAAEFALSGLAASVLAAGLGGVAAWVFVTRVLEGNWVLLPWTLLGVPLLGAVATAVLGLLGVRGALGQKAWPILRNE